MAWAYNRLCAGEFSNSVQIATEGVVTAIHLIEDREELSEAWKLVGDGAYLASLVQVEGSEQLLQILLEGLFANESDGVNGTDLEDVQGTIGGEEGSCRFKLLRCNIAAMEKMVAMTTGDRLSHSAALFNLGLAKYRLEMASPSDLTKLGVRPILQCFKEAIQSEPRNFEYWNALGVVTATHFPNVAEKAFSRSLQINERVFPT